MINITKNEEFIKIAQALNIYSNAMSSQIEDNGNVIRSSI